MFSSPGSCQVVRSKADIPKHKKVHALLRFFFDELWNSMELSQQGKNVEVEVTKRGKVRRNSLPKL